MQIKKNKYGFSLLELVISIAITSVALIAVLNFFDIDFKISSLRYSLINSNNFQNGSENLRNIIKESYMNKNGEVAVNIPLTQSSNKVYLMTSYFSPSENNGNGNGNTNYNSNNSILYVISYENEKIVVYPVNNTSLKQTLISNVSNCNILYKDINLNNTTKTNDIKTISFNITYKPDSSSEEKNIEITTKMMQET